MRRSRAFCWAIKIDPDHIPFYEEHVKADMTRFWANLCRHEYRKGDLYVVLEPPVHLRIANGIARLKSFTIPATKARMPLFRHRGRFRT